MLLIVVDKERGGGRVFADRLRAVMEQTRRLHLAHASGRVVGEAGRRASDRGRGHLVQQERGSSLAGAVGVCADMGSSEERVSDGLWKMSDVFVFILWCG